VCVRGGGGDVRLPGACVVGGGMLGGSVCALCGEVCWTAVCSVWRGMLDCSERALCGEVCWTAVSDFLNSLTVTRNLRAP
jgi:hypothetical protein